MVSRPTTKARLKFSVARVLRNMPSSRREKERVRSYCCGVKVARRPLAEMRCGSRRLNAEKMAKKGPRSCFALGFRPYIFNFGVLGGRVGRCMGVLREREREGGE